MLGFQLDLQDLSASWASRRDYLTKVWQQSAPLYDPHDMSSIASTDSKLLALSQRISFSRPVDRQVLYDNVPLVNEYKCIRILTLMPHKGKPKSEIQCELHREDLASRPEFVALSYCCGTDEKEKKRRIRVNGHKIKVLPNLGHALQQLRSSMTKQRLWVDAICIDQQDMNERKAQVSIMRDIFATAKKTIGWLGPATEHSALIFQTCKELNDHCTPDQVANDFKEAWASRLQDYRITDFDKLHLRNFDKTYWTNATMKDRCFEYLPDKAVPAIVDVLERGYFSRVWILQEAAVSKKVELQCGSLQMDLVPLLFYGTLLGTVAGHGLTMRQGVDGSADNCWHERLSGFMMLAAATDPGLSGASELSLSTVLSTFRRFECTEMKDKLFTMYTLAPEEVHKLDLKPDYTKNTVEVFMEVASKILCELHDLSILEIPRGNSKLRSRLPSWIPDWNDTSRFGVGLTPESQTDRVPMEQTSSLAIARLEELRDMQITRHSTITSRRSSVAGTHPFMQTFQSEIKDLSPVQYFKAAGSSEATSVSIDTRRVLSVEGLYFDKVKDVSEVLNELVAPPADTTDKTTHWSKVFWTLGEIESWYQRLAGDYSSSASSYPTGEGKDMAFAQTVCAGSLPGRYSFANHWKSNQDLYDSFKTWMYSWHQGQGGVKFFQPLGKAVLPRFIRQSIEVKFQGLISSLYSGRDVDGLAHAGAPTYRRRIGCTQKGYFALLPAETVIGDQIVLLKGGKLPLVVRPREETKTVELIGEAYVHGIMFGEAWKSSECESIRIS